MSRKIYTFDTTLRDGEQTPGVSLNTNEKVEIALQLERLGIDYIETGFAASSKGDLQAVRQVANVVKDCTVISLARTSKYDIDAAWEALRENENVGIHLFIATSPIHMEKKLCMTEEQVLEQAVESVKYASKYFSHIEFSCEDSTRSDIDFLCLLSERVIAAGASVLNLPDTVGFITPLEYAERFRIIQQRVRGIHNVRLSCHCHNDLGMAVANSMAAIQAGVVQVEGCINGIGERAGNASLEEIALALDTRFDVFQAKTCMNLQEISRTSKLVSRITGMPVPANKAIVGANAFAHQSGIHQDGVIKDPTTYEIIKPETVGQNESLIVLGKLSGRSALKQKLNELGYQIDGQELKLVFEQFKELADKKKDVLNEDIIALVEDRFIKHDTIYYRLDNITISYSNQGIPMASVRIIDYDQKIREGGSIGNGSVNAIYNAIDCVVDENVELLDYKIASLTYGKDALGEVFLRVKQDETVVQGRGLSTDILEASAFAYIDALNRLKHYETKDQITMETF